MRAVCRDLCRSARTTINFRQAGAWPGKETTMGYSRYIGRVGALAVALGIGAADRPHLAVSVYT